MKATVALLVPLLVLIYGCSSAPAPAVTSVEGLNQSLDLRFSARGSLPNSDDRPLVNVTNNCDRAVTVDFEGGRHYDLNVGDHREASLTIEPGSYRIRASAPSFATVQVQASAQPGNAYDLVITSRRGEPR